MSALVAFVSAAACQARAPEPAATIDEARREITGIGIRPVLAPGGFAIGQLLPGGPAVEAGLRPGDLIVAVDGEPTRRWTLERAAERLRSAAGTHVRLDVERDGQPFQVDLVRRLVAVIPPPP